LQAVLIYAQTWCGDPECPPRPKCSNSEVDVIIAIDESCSMTSQDWSKEILFSTSLASAAEMAFNSSRFAGVRFGYGLGSYNCPVAQSSQLFHSMAAGAAAFANSMPSGFNCGGTPTDEAISWFFDELNRTRIPGRLQVAILVTDGIPTLCYTSGGNCNGQLSAATPASNAAITERFTASKLPALGSLFMTVGIGSALSTTISNTNKFGSITGATLLRDFSSAPQMAFLPADFNVLVNQTLASAIDLLCFYVISVLSPARATCYTGGTMFLIKGYNFFPTQGQPMCRWQQVGTTNFLYTNATINVTNTTFLNLPGVIGLVSCPSPVVTTDLYNAYLEISRDGTYFTNNQYSVLLRTDCSAPMPPPPCPNSTIDTLFSTCNSGDFSAAGCSQNCLIASNALGYAFQAAGLYPDFTSAQIAACVNGYPSTQLTTSDKSLISTRTSPGNGPCTPHAPTTSGAGSAAMSSLMCLVCFFLSV